MNPRYNEQKKVIRRLEAALKACDKADVHIFGMDDQILWIDDEVRQRIFDAERPNDRHVLHYANVAMDEGGIIKDHGCYIDSGGA